jgi:hypothetical protein
LTARDDHRRAPPSAQGRREAFVEEVLRINQRYLTEVVEAFDVCPFARGVRTGGALARRVILDEQRPLEAGLEAAAALALDAAVEVAVLIYPRLVRSAREFDAFVAELRRADAERHGGRAVFAMAMFHPETTWTPDAPERMVMFFRRAPDPTVQLVRFSVLDAVKGEAGGGKFLFDGNLAELERRLERPSLSERIARDNFATIGREGVDRFEAIFREIRADRDASYARFGAGG